MDEYRKAVADMLSQHAKIDEGLIEVPPDDSLGDYAFPCFSLSKAMKKAPQAIATELAGKIKPTEHIQEIRAAGPYLNFFVDRKKFTGNILKAVSEKGKDFGKCQVEEKVMVEFSSPNTNKPLHLGHLRNIFLGDSVSYILESYGNIVTRTCLVNDRGIHICKSMLAYRRDGRDLEPDKKSDHFVGDYYVMFNRMAEKEPELEQEAQKMLVAWEAGDKETLALWKKMNKWALDGFDATYKRVGVSFDRLYFESEIYKEGKEIVEDGLKRGVFEKVDGATLAKLDKYRLPDKVLMRSDGTSVYMTQDLYLAIKKFKDYDIARSIYVVGSEQNLHFRQLFAILKMLSFEHAHGLYHLSYGMVYLPEGKMKSREGKVVDADDLIDEMTALSLEEVKKRQAELAPKEAERRAGTIALAALKFFMLRTDPAKDMTYDPNESISFEGETGPYVLYTYARISSIMRKHAGGLNTTPGLAGLGRDEFVLAKHLAGFSAAVSEAARSYKPSIICRYLLDLCQMFNEYYHKTPILNSGDEKEMRLLLAASVRQAIANGLGLLAIGTLEEM